MCVYKVKDLINDLMEFNPEAKIINTVDIGWEAQDSDDIDSTKKITKRVSVTGLLEVDEEL